MAWSLYSKDKFLEPLKFSNGKTQEDVVNGVLALVKEGKKIIFIQGICGTGKSAIALHLARELGKASIVVPGKNLQMQYKRDYERDKYILGKENSPLKISVITGRKNHICKYLEDNHKAIPKFKREINSKLSDIFEFEEKEELPSDLSADNIHLPCKIEIKEKNWKKIQEYLKKNKDIKYRNFLNIKDVKRISVAGVCPYWSPVLSGAYELNSKSFADSIKKRYTGLEGKEFIFYQRREGCKFYEQFNSFINSDVMVFNSMKYKLETAMNRKPLTEIEIIDECDEFLDSFSNQKSINLDRLQRSLVNIFTKEEGTYKIVKEIGEIINQLKRNSKAQEGFENEEIIPLKKTGIYDLIRIFLKTPEFLDDADEENYVFEVEAVAWMFEDFLEESYVTFRKKDGNLVANIVTTNLAKRFGEIVNKNKVIVLMSGTIHSEPVLKNIFGLNEFEIIEAETLQQGNIEVQRTGFEMDCKYSKLSKSNRGDYLKSLDKCVELSKKPVLIHVNAFIDLPSEEEIKKFGLKNIFSREKLQEVQEKDKTGKGIKKFKKGEIDVLFSTRCARGIDFPGEQCNSIIFTKYPNPNVRDAFWKILAKTNPSQYWSFYKDKARRELWQKIYRGLRFKEDHVYLLSPDSRVLEGFEKKD